MSMYKAAVSNIGDDPEPGSSDANYRWETGYEKTWQVVKHKYKFKGLTIAVSSMQY